MLHLDNVAKYYESTRALANTTLRIAPDQTTVLIGPSGCGKSTLLRLIAGLIKPDHGTVFFEGKAITADNIDQFRIRMGYVIQEGGLFPHMSVSRNVTLMAGYLGWSAGMIESRVLELLELVRMDRNLLERTFRRATPARQPDAGADAGPGYFIAR